MVHVTKQNVKKKKCYSCTWFPWLILILTLIAIILFVVWVALKMKKPGLSIRSDMKQTVNDMLRISCDNTPLEGFRNRDTICQLLNRLKNEL